MGRKDSQRKPLRLPGYDYSQAAGYFVTLCAHERSHLFGVSRDGQIVLSELGRLADSAWRRILDWSPFVSLDCYVVMPNHLHGILLLLPDTGSGSAQLAAKRAKHGFAPTQAAAHAARGATAKSLSAVIQAYKSSVAREWNRMRGSKQAAWQRGFYDHVIRDEHALQCIREYVAWNPAQWALGKENCARTALNPFYAWLETHAGNLL
jgi:REP element-mobilizing transposase RayT